MACGQAILSRPRLPFRHPGADRAATRIARHDVPRKEDRRRDAGLQRRAHARADLPRDPPRSRRRGDRDRRRQLRRHRGRSRAASASPPSCTSRIAATGPTRRPATRSRCGAAPTSTVMLHPDYQYTPRLIAAMVAMIVDGPYDVVLGSRILGGQRAPGRHAALQVRRRTVSSRWSRMRCRARSSPSTTPAIAPSRAACSRRFRCSRTRTTSSSTTRCSPR